MNQKYNVYLVSDSTGETLDRIFLSLKSQFSNFEYEKKEFAFVRTEQQIDKIIKICSESENSIILYTRQGLVVISTRCVRVERQIELVFPAKFKAGF